MMLGGTPLFKLNGSWDSVPAEAEIEQTAKNAAAIRFAKI
jgi:hypothetical protein